MLVFQIVHSSQILRFAPGDFTFTCYNSDTFTAYRYSETCSLIFVVSNQTEQELLCLTNTSPVDLLCEPVPSCLPSPQLRPDPVVLESADLIQFEERPAPLPGKSLPPYAVSNQAEFFLSILLPNSREIFFFTRAEPQ